MDLFINILAINSTHSYLCIIATCMTPQVPTQCLKYFSVWLKLKEKSIIRTCSGGCAHHLAQLLSLPHDAGGDGGMAHLGLQFLTPPRPHQHGRAALRGTVPATPPALSSPSGFNRQSRSFAMPVHIRAPSTVNHSAFSNHESGASHATSTKRNWKPHSLDLFIFSCF